MTPARWATPWTLVYVAAVALLAAVGFIGQSPWPILLAALLALPASIVAVPCYYLGYGLLALIPGANPSSSSGSSTSAPWFTLTTQILGILALTAAAVLNVLLFRALAARRRRIQAATPSDAAIGPPPS